MLVTDANDNVPVFESDAFEFTVREDAVSGEPLGSVTATDADSGRFGQVSHSNTFHSVWQCVYLLVVFWGLL